MKKETVEERIAGEIEHARNNLMRYFADERLVVVDYDISDDGDEVFLTDKHGGVVKVISFERFLVISDYDNYQIT